MDNSGSAPIPYAQLTSATNCSDCARFPPTVADCRRLSPTQFTTHDATKLDDSLSRRFRRCELLRRQTPALNWSPIRLHLSVCECGRPCDSRQLIIIAQEIGKSDDVTGRIVASRLRRRVVFDDWATSKNTCPTWQLLFTCCCLLFPAILFLHLCYEITKKLRCCFIYTQYSILRRKPQNYKVKLMRYAAEIF